MKKRTFINILLCATMGAILYYAYNQIDHYLSYQVFAGNAWTILMYLFFSYTIAVIVCMPIIWSMKKLKIYNHFSILILSTLIIGVIITISNNGVLLQHPEGFVIGFISGSVFLILERINASNKALK